MSRNDLFVYVALFVAWALIAAWAYRISRKTNRVEAGLEALAKQSSPRGTS
jgi:hypothetical protein